MPIYEYACTHCQHVIERWVPTLDEKAEPSVCLACHQGTLAPIVSVSAFQLKGNGWYATDFKAGPSNANAPAQSGEAS